MQYDTVRPPLMQLYEFPCPEELLKLNVGDTVKLIFQVEDDVTERKWVTITEQCNPRKWKGTVDPNPLVEETADTLDHCREISFHPLDIILIKAPE